MSRHGEFLGEPDTGLLFGSVAEDYERFRMGYPNDLGAAVRTYAGRPINTALEVGAGTGKATRRFASRGIQVTALEPDAAMAALLARITFGLPVEPVVSTFEQFDSGRQFDLIYAAAAWHWTDPMTRWTRAVQLLVPRGVLALFGRPCELADPDLFATVDEIEQSYVSPDRQDAGHLWSVEDVARVDGLTDVVEQDFPSAAVVTAAEFVGRLATVSVYLALDPDDRTEALRQVRAVLPEQVDIDTTTRLVMARRI